MCVIHSQKKKSIMKQHNKAIQKNKADKVRQSAHDAPLLVLLNDW